MSRRRRRERPTSSPARRGALSNPARTYAISSDATLVRTISLRYVSTRGTAPDLDFDAVLLTGLARDGGLYVPAEWPVLTAADWADLDGRPYAEVATRVMAPYVAGSITPDTLAGLVAGAYAGFRHPAVAPLKQIGGTDWVLELFHGPTPAFKDYALQLLRLLFGHVLAKHGRRIAVLGATSGDNG